MNTILLKRGEILKLRRASGLELQLRFGRVWLTEEASNDDVWLEPGAHAKVRGDGLAVVEAFATSEIAFRT